MSLRVLKNISLMSAANKKFCISKQPCNVLFFTTKDAFIVYLKKIRSRIISHMCPISDITTCGIAFLSIFYHSVYH